MKYLFYDKNAGNKVTLIYYEKPPSKLIEDSDYITTTSLPKNEYQDSKLATLYCNPTTKELWYEYEDVPKSEEVIQKERIDSLEQSIGELTTLVSLMMGGE